MRTEDLEQLEIDLLLEGVFRRYGYDFRQYARGSLRRRIYKRVLEERASSISNLQELVLRDPQAMERLVLELSINVTAMFRDPSFYLSLRSRVVPLLHTYPFIRIWVAGCSTGEEVYSLAMLLHEEGLHERARIYATDINEQVLQRAEERIFPLEQMRSYTENYIKAGGRKAFSEYYSAGPKGATFERQLIENVVFAQHNLVSDRSFNEFNLIMCRNVMIYFDKALQNHVHDLFHRSLVNFGILTLGRKESIKFTSHENSYEPIDGLERIYKKVK